MIEPSAEAVEQTVRIGASPQTVWKYWTEARWMCEWWGTEAELDARPGGVCRIVTQGGLVMRGEYLEVVPFERLVFSFGWEAHADAPDVPPGSSRVEVTLFEDGRDTMLTVRHTGLAGSVEGIHSTGWSHFLPLLATAAAPSTSKEANR